VRRGEHCDIARESLVAAVETPWIRAPTSDGADSVPLTMVDMELLHHFTTSTSLTISSEPLVRNFMRVSVPPIGFSHPYVLYSALALAALHLARFRPEQREYYIAQAEIRHAIAASMARPLLSNLTTTNRTPILLFSALTSYIAFASPKESGHFVFSEHDAMPSWLSLFRGVRTVIELNDVGSDFSSISCLFMAGYEVNKIWISRDVEHDALNELESYIKTSTSRDDQSIMLLMEAIDHLKRAYHVFFGGELSSDKKYSVIFTWMYKMSEGFLALLRQRDSGALCVLAFFCVLLHKLEHHWWLEGWTLHLVEHIYGAIDELHRLWIRWPIEEIGWIPRPAMSQNASPGAGP
jgi:hypothetical protein